MISLIGMFLLLLTAGIAHLVTPNKFLFLIPGWMPLKKESIYLTGGFEIILAIGLMLSEYRSISSKTLTWYFVFLEIFHIYVAYYQIPMFRIKHPALLWGRVVAQFMLIYWAWSLRNF